MNCIQPTAPAEETLRLVPKAVSISLIAASTLGALRAEAVGVGGPLVDRDQDRRHARRRRSWSWGARGSRRAAAEAGRRAPPSPLRRARLGSSASGAGVRLGLRPRRAAIAACRFGVGTAGRARPAGGDQRVALLDAGSAARARSVPAGGGRPVSPLRRHRRRGGRRRSAATRRGRRQRQRHAASRMSPSRRLIRARP